MRHTHTYVFKGDASMYCIYTSPTLIGELKKNSTNNTLGSEIIILNMSYIIRSRDSSRNELIIRKK